MFNNIYSNKKIFITGHTGFKGSWLTQWLLKLGAIVKGYSLHAEERSHFNLLDLEKKENLENDFYDIRNIAILTESINRFQPDLVFHLAAQPLVLKSYEDHKYTYETNIQGTINLFEACKSCKSIKGIVCITTDKVYKDIENNFYAYRESDEIGAHDPYSTSKACCELIIETYKKQFNNLLITSLRAGNVIGGGDFAQDRIIPDYIKSIENKKDFILRNPYSIRPYQYVLDVLKGYLMVGERFLNEENTPPLNFGPEQNDIIDNLQLVEELQKYFYKEIKFSDPLTRKLESNYLSLDSIKAKRLLKWKPKYNIKYAIEKTMKWYEKYIKNNQIITDLQIESYCDGDLT